MSQGYITLSMKDPAEDISSIKSMDILIMEYTITFDKWTLDKDKLSHNNFDIYSIGRQYDVENQTLFLAMNNGLIIKLNWIPKYPKIMSFKIEGFPRWRDYHCKLVKN